MGGPGSTGEPVFVCGLGRSGTTWIARSLAESPELVYVGEAWLIEKLHELVEWHGMLIDKWSQFATWRDCGIGREAFARAVSRLYGDLLSEAAAGKRFVEKTPDWNLFHLSFLAELFPDACFILVYRDGRNYVASAEGKRRKETRDFDFEDFCRRWSRAMVVLGEARESGIPRRALFVRYEDLVDRFADLFADLCEFVGIEPIEAPALPPNSSFPNHHRAEDFKSRWHDWSAERKELFRMHAGDQLVRWGYVDAVDGW